MKIKFKQRADVGIFCHDLLTKTVKFTLPQLMPPEDYDDLELTISIKERAGKTVNIMGTCTPDFNFDFTKNRKPQIILNKKFFITIHKHLHELDQVETMIHELVHVKQYIFGELKVAKNGLCWENKRMYPYKNYRRSPWEKEAFLFEREIFSEFLDTHYEELSDLVDSSQRLLYNGEKVLILNEATIPKKKKVAKKKKPKPVVKVQSPAPVDSPSISRSISIFLKRFLWF